MRVQLLPFGVLKDALTETPLELPAQATVADLLTVLRDRLRAQPAAAQLLSRIAVSVNAEYAQGSQRLCEGDMVGLLPPVSGGNGVAFSGLYPTDAGKDSRGRTDCGGEAGKRRSCGGL